MSLGESTADGPPTAKVAADWLRASPRRSNRWGGAAMSPVRLGAAKDAGLAEVTSATRDHARPADPETTPTRRHHLVATVIPAGSTGQSPQPRTPKVARREASRSRPGVESPSPAGFSLAAPEPPPVHRSPHSSKSRRKSRDAGHFLVSRDHDNSSIARPAPAARGPRKSLPSRWPPHRGLESEQRPETW